MVGFTAINYSPCKLILKIYQEEHYLTYQKFFSYFGINDIYYFKIATNRHHYIYSNVGPGITNRRYQPFAGLS